MASIRNSDTITKLATQDLSSNLQRFVIQDSDTTVDLVTAIGDKPIGVQLSASQATLGKETVVKVASEVKVEVSEAIAINALVSCSANGRAQNAVAGQYIMGVCTFAAGAAGDLCVIYLFVAPTMYNGLYAAGSAAGIVYDKVGGASFLDGGWERRVVEESIALSTAAIHTMTLEIPIGAVIRLVQANLETLIVATTATDVGIGTETGTDDPNLYGLSGDLLQNTKIDTIPDWAVLSAAEEIGVFACDSAGDAAGTLNSGTVRVRVVYDIPLSLVNA